MNTTTGDGKVKLSIGSFKRDFVRGLSEQELADTYSLNTDQVRKVAGVLSKKGDLTADDLKQRKENLKIRVGGDKEPRSAEQAPGTVTVDQDSGIVMHCPSCGASVERHASNCNYCAAHLDFSLKGKTKHCPHCYMKIPAESRFCTRCAKPAKLTVQEGKLLEDRLCPRCEVAMLGRTVGEFPVMGCPKCSGLFVHHETFEMMQDNTQRIVEVTDGQIRPVVEPEASVQYLRCPVCRLMMNRKNFAGASGVIIDICRAHGIWFDAGELEGIMTFISKGGLRDARARQLESLESEEKLVKYRSQAPNSGASHGGYLGGSYEKESDFDLYYIVRGIFRLFG
jgi:Zn-finger nucleic acid-binding protein